MARPKRQLKQTYVIFCEGNTECNYFNGMRQLPTIDVLAKPINMHGGGYAHFLDEVKKDSRQNRLATFIVVDGDRAQSIPKEKLNLREMINFCERQNKKDGAPYILIINNLDFEYVACLHDLSYHGGNTAQYISNEFPYGSLDEFKADPNIYIFLNTKLRHYSVMLQRLAQRPKLLQNEIEKSNLHVRVKRTFYNEENLGKNTSNINEIFEVLGLQDGEQIGGMEP